MEVRILELHTDILHIWQGHLLLFQVHYQDAASGGEQLRLKTALASDASLTGGSITHYTIMVAPQYTASVSKDSSSVRFFFFLVL